MERYPKGEVYCVFENSMRGELQDIYISEELANKAINDSKGELMNIVQPMKIKGYVNKFDIPIGENCKYYDPRLNMVRELISCLYQIEGCSCGGLAHVMVDDNNFTDSTIKCVRKCCDEEPDKLEVGLVRLICDEMEKLSLQQRALLFTSYYSYPICSGEGTICECCRIEKGEMEEA